MGVDVTHYLFYGWSIKEKIEPDESFYDQNEYHFISDDRGTFHYFGKIVETGDEENPFSHINLKNCNPTINEFEAHKVFEKYFNRHRNILDYFPSLFLFTNYS